MPVKKPEEMTLGELVQEVSILSVNHALRVYGQDGKGSPYSSHSEIVDYW